jgi:hypothetical protein
LLKGDSSLPVVEANEPAAARALRNRVG